MPPNVDRPTRRGIALYIVSIVIAMIAVGALALLSLLSTEYEATVLRGDEIQAGQLVQSGIEFVAQRVATPETEPLPSGSEFSDPFVSPSLPVDGTEIPGNDSNVWTSGLFGENTPSNPLYDNPGWFRGIEVVPARFGRLSRGSGRFTVFSPRIEQGRLRGIRFGLVNESTRLHLGTVLEWETESPGQGARSLLKLPGMTPSIADSILDWIDPDKTARPSGAELDYYEQAGLPYRPRNAVPVTLEELLLVRDMTRALLFGTDESFSYGAKMSDLQRMQAEADIQADLLFQTPVEPVAGTSPETTTDSPPEEPNFFAGQFADDVPALDGSTSETSLPWCFLLTTLSAEKLVDPNGNAKFYLNDGNLEFLEEQLRRHLDEEATRFVMAWRKNNGNISDPIDLLDATLTDKDTSEELKSPFTLENAVGEDKFLTLLDYATEHSNIVLSGRINVNESPGIVLETVPELSSSTVSQILARRGAAGEVKKGRFRHPVWLLSEKIVDKETMKKLSKRLTTGGDVYRGQAVGFFDGQGTTSRAEFVVDATVKPPRQIFSKDLTMFGSGFD